MAFIDLVSWNSESSNLYAWRYPETNLTTLTQLIVHESQEAVLFSKGQIIGKFGPGRYTLNTENLPVLHNLYGIPFGKKNPFTAEVWFVNKRIPLNINWNISKMMVTDPEFKYVPLVASGRYGLKIASAEKFLINLVGTASTFDASQLTDHFQGQMEQNTKAAIVNYITSNNISVTHVSSHLNEIADALKIQLNSFWEDYGFDIAGFFITSIEIDESSEAGKTIVEAIASSSAQRIAGFTWQQEQAMKVAGNAVTGGGDMGILGMAMFAGTMGGNGNFANNLMQPPYQQQNQGYAQNQVVGNTQNQRRTVFCSHCGKTYSTTSRFCPHCGNPYRPCPVCGSDNSENAKRCVSCGSMLPKTQTEMAQEAGLACPKCGNPISSDTRFCPNCGTKL